MLFYLFIYTDSFSVWLCGWRVAPLSLTYLIHTHNMHASINVERSAFEETIPRVNKLTKKLYNSTGVESERWTADSAAYFMGKAIKDS